MTGLPNPFHVKLDDGTGTFPTDITTRAVMDYSISAGRTDEFSNPEAAQLSLVLDNADGHVTDGTIAIQPGTGIRLTETIGATTSDRFTGKIIALDLGWPGGGQEFATVTVTAVDVLADLGRREMQSMLQEEILLDSPTAYYTLGEAQGATTAGDTSGNTNKTLAILGSGAALAFGKSMGLIDDWTGVDFSQGTYLRASQSSWIGTGSFTASAFFQCGTAPGTTQTVVCLSEDSTGANANHYFTLDITSLGTAHASLVSTIGNIINGSANVCDGNLHHLALSYDGTTLRLYVDGVLDGSTAVTTAPTVAMRYFFIGTGLGQLNGNVGHVVLNDGVTLSATRLLAYYNVGSGASETADVRATRLASYAGLTVTTSSGSGQTMGAQATNGSSMFDALQTVATAEGGVLYANGSGSLILQGRFYRALETTADLTLGEQEAGVDTAVTWDTQQKINRVSVTRTGGATQVVLNAADIAANYAYPTSLEVAVDNDDDALDAANRLLNKHTTTSPRLASVTFDLMTSTNAAAILALNIGDRLSLSALPSQMWAGAGDYTVEGWSESLTADAWTLTCNILPWSLFEALVLDDAAYGLLDTDTLGN